MSEENDNKPNLDVPEHLEYSDEHVWVDASVDPAVIGITEYAANQLGDLVFVDLPEVGTRVEAGDEIVTLDRADAMADAAHRQGVEGVAHPFPRPPFAGVAGERQSGLGGEFCSGRAAGGGFRIEARLPAMPNKTIQESVHEQ